MTEDTFGQWKRRFPVLRSLRTFVPKSQNIILATAILHNMAKVWLEEDFSDDEEEEEDVEQDDVDVVIIPPNIVAGEIRRRGQENRLRLMRAMRGATVEERIRLYR